MDATPRPRLETAALAAMFAVPLACALAVVALLLWHPWARLALCTAARGGDALGFDWRVGTVSANTALPIWREVLMAMGFVNARRESLDHCLRSGTSVVLVPGGAKESLHAQPGRADLVLACRKGFVKLALAHGAPLVPVWCFGENELYHIVHSPAARTFQDALLRLVGFTIPLAVGVGCCLRRSAGLLPRRVPLNVVVGAPLATPVIAQPTPEQVDEWHGRYVAALRTLYEAHANRFYGPGGGMYEEEEQAKLREGAASVPPFNVVR